MISLLSLVIWSSSVFFVWDEWVFGFLGWYLGCELYSLFMSLLSYLSQASLSYVLKLLSVLWQPFWLFFWTLSLWNPYFFPLMFNSFLFKFLFNYIWNWFALYKSYKFMIHIVQFLLKCSPLVVSTSIL